MKDQNHSRGAAKPLNDASLFGLPNRALRTGIGKFQKIRPTLPILLASNVVMAIEGLIDKTVSSRRAGLVPAACLHPAPLLGCNRFNKPRRLRMISIRRMWSLRA